MRTEEEQFERLETELLNLRNACQKDHDFEAAAFITQALDRLQAILLP